LCCSFFVWIGSFVFVMALSHIHIIVLEDINGYVP
jgi:hypothetical protein